MRQKMSDLRAKWKSATSKKAMKLKELMRICLLNQIKTTRGRVGVFNAQNNVVALSPPPQTLAVKCL